LIHQTEIKAFQRLLLASNFINRHASFDQKPHDLIGASALLQCNKLAVPFVSDESCLAQSTRPNFEITGPDTHPLLALFGLGQSSFENFATAIQYRDSGTELFHLTEKVGRK